MWIYIASVSSSRRWDMYHTV